MKTTISRPTVLACVPSPLAAEALDRFELRGREYVTPVSGYAGIAAAHRTGDGETAVRAIVWDATPARSCGPLPVFVNLNRIEPATLSYATPLDCEGTHEQAVSIAHAYVYKLSVCTAPAPDRAGEVAGVRVWRRTLTYQDYKRNDRPLLRDSPVPHETHDARCSDWQPPVACDPGEIAAGVRDRVTGLALVCRRLALSETPMSAARSPKAAPHRALARAVALHRM